MKDSIDEGLHRGCGDERVADFGTQSQPAPLEVRRVDQPGGPVLILTGELDLVTAPALQSRLRSAARGNATVAIDLSGLRFIDSSGLNVLVRAQRRLRASGGCLVLVAAPRAVRRAFEVMGLDRHFEWRDSMDAALRPGPENALRGGRR